MYGYLFREEDGTTYIAQEFQRVGDTLFHIEGHQVIPDTVGQYTGIDLVQEKNGMNVWVTEIYEGDLIANSDGVVSKVIYYDGAYRLQSIRQAALLDKEFINVLKYKVVGNIYENPKLMTHKYTKNESKI